MPFINSWDAKIKERATLLDCLYWVAHNEIPISDSDRLSNIFSEDRVEYKYSALCKDFDEYILQAQIQLYYLLRRGELTATGKHHQPWLDHPCYNHNEKIDLTDFSYGAKNADDIIKIPKAAWQVVPTDTNWICSTQLRQSISMNPKIISFTNITVLTVQLLSLFKHKDIKSILGKYNNGEQLYTQLQPLLTKGKTIEKMRRKTRKGKGGRKVKYSWGIFDEELTRYIKEKGVLPKPRSTAVLHMQKWAQLNWVKDPDNPDDLNDPDKKGEPSETMIKEKVKAFYTSYKEKNQ